MSRTGIEPVTYRLSSENTAYWSTLYERTFTGIRLQVYQSQNRIHTVKSDYTYP
eukprot:SAG22_NODE_242_length_14104_cov_13.581935_11_plen_54_part_00